MGNIRIHLEDFPPHIKGFLVEAFDEGENWYCIFVNAKLDDLSKIQVVKHELEHIHNKDFSSSFSADSIENSSHFG